MAEAGTSTADDPDDIVSHKAKVIQHLTQSAETHFFESRPSMDLIQARVQAKELLSNLSAIQDQFSLHEFGSVGYGLDSNTSDYDLLAVKKSDAEGGDEAADSYYSENYYPGIDVLTSVAEVRILTLFVLCSFGHLPFWFT